MPVALALPRVPYATRIRDRRRDGAAACDTSLLIWKLFTSARTCVAWLDSSSAAAADSSEFAAADWVTAFIRSTACEI